MSRRRERGTRESEDSRFSSTTQSGMKPPSALASSRRPTANRSSTNSSQTVAHAASAIHAQLMSAVPHGLPRVPRYAQDDDRDCKADQRVAEVEAERHHGGARYHRQAHVGVGPSVIAVG